VVTYEIEHYFFKTCAKLFISRILGEQCTDQYF